ncbi:MAG TPA: sulfatase-like hydrolase/transferase [Candidatus Avoscillospira avicola]|uniref:Sulfatase-like hydrolase/transferase n=1 Tax=Candidatus Avoscillospira avicola TaxID=2840706 RepID=A0A9D1DGA2_9FIRM|nr:sulfatase-like hydrolase/transferase [Candidatus Avoscillospira avicola]
MSKRFFSSGREWLSLILALAVPVYLEVVLHLCIYHQVNGRIIFPILFALSVGALLFALCSLLPPKAGKWMLCLLLGLLTFYFEVQLVYNSIFGEFMALMQMFTGAGAITNFFWQTLYGIWQAMPMVLLLLIPAVVTIVLAAKNVFVLPQLKWYRPVAAVAAFVLIHFGTVAVMAAGGDGPYTVYGLYTSAGTGTEVSVHNIGLLSTTRLECKYMLFPQDGQENAELTVSLGVPDYDLDPKEYNVLDLDFEALEGSTNNEALQALDRYFASEEATEKNEYTGLLEGYNLITICAESFSSRLIDPERTPTLYYLSTNGLIFENYYGTYGSNTTNGEYTFCMGNYPDMSRSKAAASFFASQKNYLPFCLGNEFLEQGYQTWAYHNYSGEYYSRRDTHPNMGYTFQSAGDGLDIEINWPSSDLEMMEASMDDYLSSDQPFHAYYMTFSGHYQYDWNNPMSLKNKAMAENLPYSEAVQAYIACNNELEQAMTYLLGRLEEAGVADKTVIILTNDHYPYGLTIDQFSELAGEEIDETFEKYRNSFICYIPGMEPTTIDTYCSTVDILPTILNLFGLPYDSRLLAGRDILSPQAYDMAVLSDQSFVTENYGFDAATGEVVVFTEGYEVDETDLLQRQTIIQNQFQASLDVLNQDYYAHALPDGAEVTEDDQNEEATMELPFTDIPEGKSLDPISFLWGNGYMDPISETKFGYDVTTTYVELLDTLYRMAGSPNMDNTWVDMGSTRPITGKYLNCVKWAADLGILSRPVEGLSSYTPLLRSDACLTILNYARTLGYSDAVDDEALLAEMAAQHPEFTAEESRALHWCYNHLIIQGSGGKLLTVMDDDPELSRYSLAKVVYNFWLYVLQGS